MKNRDDLLDLLKRIDGRGYKAYKDIKDRYDFEQFELIIDHVQGDPFALPSKMRVRVAQSVAGFPVDTFSNPSRQIALCDFLARQFHQATGRYVKGNRGTGKGGLIGIDRPGQEILQTTAIIVQEDFVEARFVFGLPAFGRRIAGRDAAEMFLDELPQVTEAALLFTNLDHDKLYEHIKTAEDADVLRAKLPELNLLAFVDDGAILPRASGIDPRPMSSGKAVPFQSPESMRVAVDLPNTGKITGMGIKEGITLIVGGGYHGKSTLLNALALGIYNHIPGDGRERVVSNPTMMKIRAEDGRRIEKVAIDPFINNLPLGQDTHAFCSENASGSTSQAANIIEALEAGTRVLLIDEDTSATNFMIRDHRMQELVSKDREPITPFIDKARQLYTDLGISTVLVIGGSGDYFDIADHVICMHDYQPQDYTEQAKAVAEKYRAERQPEGGESFGQLHDRIPVRNSFDPSRNNRAVKISTNGRHSIGFGRTDIDLTAVEQIVNISQTRAIAEAIYYATRYMDGQKNLTQVLDLVEQDIQTHGLDVLSNEPTGNFAIFRKLELAAAINRLRTLTVQ
ncbi:MAG: ABC-ATPase domain-containing protein [Phycisphaerae bacterium]|nr:ABC-ATPase domain-containing protein [Phycisphaerae bacterium]